MRIEKCCVSQSVSAFESLKIKGVPWSESRPSTRWRLGLRSAIRWLPFRGSKGSNLSDRPRYAAFTTPYHTNTPTDPSIYHHLSNSSSCVPPVDKTPSRRHINLPINPICTVIGNTPRNPGVSNNTRPTSWATDKLRASAHKKPPKPGQRASFSLCSLLTYSTRIRGYAMKTKINRRSITLAMLIATPLVLVGCASSGPSHAGNIDSIRWDPSPAMHTLARRDSDRLNMYARTRDSNFRMLSTDIDKMWFLDRPSRLYRGIKP